jgi:hypothetical protein
MAAPRDLTDSFTNFLRRKIKFSCIICGEEFLDVDDRIKKHLLERHADYLGGKDITVVINKIGRKGGNGWAALLFHSP